jgi:hypothetical protein
MFIIKFNTTLKNTQVLTSFIFLLTLSLNTSGTAQLDSTFQADSLEEKSFPGFLNIAFNQTLALEIREVEIGYGFNFKGKSSLDISVGIVSGFFIDTDKTTPNSSESSTQKFNNETVQGFGRHLAVNFFHDHGPAYGSGLFHSISLKFQKFQSVRNPQELIFDHYHLSIDEFNTTIGSMALGLGYKYQFSESALRLAVAWEFHQTNYEANGSQFASQKSSIINTNEELSYHDEFLTNTVTLKVSWHL